LGDGLNLLKLLSRSITATRIKRILEVKQDKSQDANQNVVSVLLSMAQVMKILKDIQDKNIKLDGAVLLTSTGGFYSNNAANSVAPVMRKGTRQW